MDDMTWGSEMFGPLLLKDDIVAEPLHYHEFGVDLPEGPGLGVILDEDGEYNEQKIKAMHAAFEDEDVPIIEAVHQEMDTTDFFSLSLNPVLMSNDIAPVKVRKVLGKLIGGGAQGKSR